MAADKRRLFADDDYRMSWWEHKSDLVERKRGYRLEDVGEMVLGGKVAVTWVRSPYPDQARAVLRLMGSFFTLVTEDSKDVPNYDHLITYFESDDKEINAYYKEHGA